MARFLFLAALAFTGCGKSECEKFLGVFCLKAIQCDVPGYRAIGLKQCQENGKEIFKITEPDEQGCVQAAHDMKDLNCPTFFYWLKENHYE